jgi:hypothetical protein
MRADRRILADGALLPDITITSLLESLRSTTARETTMSVMPTIIYLARDITKLQQLLRMHGAIRRNEWTQLSDEIGHVSNAPERMSEPNDWLLLQIDYNFIIRPDQREVAEAMIAPKSGENSVLQMNMGLGKSSVIIPMIVTRLANKRSLARVVVPRALLLPMGQLLQARLGGLIGRIVKHVPFSRKSSATIESVKAYHQLHSDVLGKQGVMLTLPEHILSFQLSGLQQLVNGHPKQAELMLNVQAWFSRKCRDVLDECDHMLAVKTQLIYPSGSQNIIDGHPIRWKVVQNLLTLVKVSGRYLSRRYPKGIEIIDRGSGTFPTIYLLDQVVKDAMILSLTDSILRGEGAILPVESWQANDLEYARRFISEARIDETALQSGSRVFEVDTDTRRILLLLRGLLVHRILLMALGKRYNVMYGIHPERDPIAVPFRAKGLPSQEAEFGHPDVAIILTCLSFYYSGLTFEQFRDCLSQLLKSDEPAHDFEAWINEVIDADLPKSLRSWNAINVDDELQCKQLWKPLRQQMTVIDYFLNHFVFPRHAKTFERKIVSSGWDIPLLDLSLPEKQNVATRKENGRPTPNGSQPRRLATSLTTGFSGTSDNKALLPLSIKQNDLPGLSHTNAEVLTYLLEPRNLRYEAAADPRNGRRRTEREFLYRLMKLGIRMFIDAGALILELDNLGLVKLWMQIDPHAEAAVFFGADGVIRVLYRDGKQQPLTASPFLNNLGACLVYLDEAHTRGVDLKMPADTVAALTIGMMQTKDHTVQGEQALTFAKH